MSRQSYQPGASYVGESYYGTTGNAYEPYVGYGTGCLSCANYTTQADPYSRSQLYHGSQYGGNGTVYGTSAISHTSGMGYNSGSGYGYPAGVVSPQHARTSYQPERDIYDLY